MEIIPVMLVFGLLRSFEATHCDKELNYHTDYAYGFDITCEGLSDATQDMLKQISVDQEVVLRINNSNLTKVTSDLFSEVEQIRYLSITNSTFLLKPNEKPFTNLANLEHLTVENTRFNDLDSRVLNGLDDLKELNLVNISLRVVKNDTFRSLKELEVLKLTNNQLDNMLGIPFCDLPVLKTLHLNGNRIVKIDKFICLEEENESGIILNGESIEISPGKNNFFHRAKSNTNLVELNLSHNKIKTIGAFDWALDLKHLDLANNRLVSISDKVFSLLGHLQRLCLKNNLLEVVHPKAFARLRRLKFVDLANNSLTSVVLENLFNLEEIDLSRNKLNSSSLKNLVNLPNLRVLSLQDNQIQNLPLNIFQNFSSLEHLDLSNNNLVLTTNSFRGLSALKTLSIRNNSLEMIPKGAFNNLSSLEILDMSINKLTTLEGSRLFVNLQDLQTLNMSHNLLTNFSYDLIMLLYNLEVLDISGNRLQNFQFNLVSLLPSLRIINIKSNLLSCSVLSKIIVFFNSKNISFTINEEFDYDRRNIGGIYCEEVASKMMGMDGEGSGMHLSVAGILFIIAVSAVVVAFALYRCMLYARRRRYMFDEIELL
ncbi:hypothetical protein MTP99_013637 [Tenebrio molitor]|jgi:Leucine-rich repeat (LRR) protein|nr:hypothetical protein MTP99_013637 [Tenebrio molitor]